ncbi:XdhC family protein [Colwellia sp. 1_MG-2023]|uniref:XdhC family protein n=1 Tax=unclassified Colwellia TaxID=196834 RepID=UPI001C09B9CE|nr:MULTISPECIES: XdhC family protein [unclassified Colwellia]MBU2924274.1 XdhC family protein [Colwellia sp. C2M11]MDO6652983.1 XdhC family protein [Colwellia sp. 3_MG-2023]MDO6665465.1 XdhC family protein [Colwellia sp. 2_MG-2023]MDO6689776.1 XdhC family protein [Colwellia sp. 1_MG-2023]
MSNRLEQLLAKWQPQKSSLSWVLATVIETDGSSYRKQGAMMFINSLGQYFGLLSGGCLEAEIMLKARKCWDTGNNYIVCYDMRDEDDLSWQLGIGCGGMVKILLQPITQTSNWLQLEKLQASLLAKQSCIYKQSISESSPENTLTLFNDHHLTTESLLTTEGKFIHHIKPAPSITIFGGGIDAVPVVKMAKILGWSITVIDERVNYARGIHFSDVDSIIRQPLTELTKEACLAHTDVIVIMTHNVKLDAKALQFVQGSKAKFVGLLGPTHRTKKVLDEANLSSQQLSTPLSNPVGLNIGGELPESIALSILSEAHAVLEGKSGQTLMQSA